MGDIIKEILKEVPEDKITDVFFEGANIVLYTNSKEFFLDDKGVIRKVVNDLKKRIELRPDPSLCLEPEKAEKKIKKILKDIDVSQVIFDPQRSIVIIEVDKPGLAIGKKGENLHKIKSETLWIPKFRRTPPIRSKLIESIRMVLYQNSDYRRKFLHKIGQRIYNGWQRSRREEWIRVSYLGSARQVGRSCILLQTPESRVLLDCGIDVSESKDIYPHLEAPEFKIEELDAVILSHAHIDHSGLIPYLFKFGYRGPVYCTEPTRDISALLQLDLIKIAISEGKDPIYTADEVKEFVKHTVCLEYDEVTDITPDVRITLYNAGHILGSSMVHIHIGNGLHNMLYTGDIKFSKTHLLAPAATKFPRLETLMIESTYGSQNKDVPSQAEIDKAVAEMITKTIKRRGKVLIPTLGSGRGQEIIVFVDKLMREGLLEEVPIYIDGLVWDITAIHTAYPEFLNNNMKKLIFHNDENPFLRDNIKQIGSQKERKQLVEEEGPCIIIATSGMLNGGPSVFFLRELADNPNNLLLFSCYQAEGTLGRRIQEGIKEFNYQENGKIRTVPINLEVSKVEISGHASRTELFNFVKKLNPRPRKVIVNHGEPQAVTNVAKMISKSFRMETYAPRNLDAIRIK